ncbi:MAG: hypothetical protein ACREN8_04825 [Candidatus Dormibacteraceae bacterium]
MNIQDDLFNREISAALFNDAQKAIPNGTTVLPAVRARLSQIKAARPHGLPNRSPRWRKPLVLSLAAGILIAALAASPFVQATTSPFARWLLQGAGIAPKNARQIDLYQNRDKGAPIQATSSGYTIALVGTYSDQFHTVLFLRPTPNALLGAMRVTDESGKDLQGGGGRLMSVDGEPAAIEFNALSPGPHQLTMHISFINTSNYSKSPTIWGNWVLHIPVETNSAKVAAATPATGVLGKVHMTVHPVGGDGKMLVLQFETTGATIDQLSKDLRPDPGAFKINVYDAAGHHLNFYDNAGSLTKELGAAECSNADGAIGGNVLTCTQHLQGTGPGTYKLVATYEGHSFESKFTIS